MIKNMKHEEIAALMDALPFEMMFVDKNDCVQYANQLETRFFRFKREKIEGQDVRNCMKKETLPKVEKILSDFKSGKADEAEFWIPSLAPRILNRFIALRDKDGKYLGVFEYVLDFKVMDQIEEDKKDAPKL